MEELIKQYLKEHLSINVCEKSYGFNGRCMTFELKLDDEIISSDSFDISRDEG